MYCYTGICNSVIRSGFVYLIMCFLDFDPFYNDLIKSKPFNLGWLSTLIQAGKESYVDDCSLIEQTFKILGLFVEWKCHLYKVYSLLHWNYVICHFHGKTAEIIIQGYFPAEVFFLLSSPLCLTGGYVYVSNAGNSMPTCRLLPCTQICPISLYQGITK